MTCSGCSGAINRVLTKAQNEGVGVDEFDVSLEKQEVIVKGDILYDDLEARIKKTGKQVSSLSNLCIFRCDGCDVWGMSGDDWFGFGLGFWLQLRS